MAVAVQNDIRRNYPVDPGILAAQEAARIAEDKNRKRKEDSQLARSSISPFKSIALPDVQSFRPAAPGAEATDKATENNAQDMTAADVDTASASQIAQSRAEAKKEKTAEEEKKKKSDAFSEKIKGGTNWLLRLSWFSVFTVAGLLPGLLYINLHVFCRLVVGDKFFCKLGHEWKPITMGSEGDSSGKMLTAMIGLGEILALLILDLAVGFAVLLMLGIVTIIVDIYIKLSNMSIFEMIIKAISLLWEGGLSLLTALIQLIKVAFGL